MWPRRFGWGRKGHVAKGNFAKLNLLRAPLRNAGATWPGVRFCNSQVRQLDFDADRSAAARALQVDLQPVRGAAIGGRVLNGSRSLLNAIGKLFCIGQ